MRNIRIDRLEYSVKIAVDTNYRILPHNCLTANYGENKNTIVIQTLSKDETILVFDKEELTNVHYKEKNTDIVEYINKLL